MNFASKGFGEQVLSMQSASPIDAGTPVELTANYTVAAAAENNAFCGVVLSCRDNICAVQLHGSITLPYSGTAPTVGAGTLVCAGSGKVKTAESGANVLVLAVDTVAETVTCIL